MGETTLAIVLLVIFDFAVLYLFRLSMKDLKISNVLREKSIVSSSGQDIQASDETSFSRLAGLLGAIVLTVFFWMLGNVVIWELLVTPTAVAGSIDSTYKYILVGATLFAPYAVNQLVSIFR